MKIAAATLSLLLPSTVAWVQPSLSSSSATSTRLYSAATASKPAASFEEDLELTLKIILDHASRSTTTSQEQMLAQVEEAKNVEPAQEVDISIPYDAPAKLAYEASGKGSDYAAFKADFEAQAVADVIAKQPKKEAPAAPAPAAVVDLSIPYDATAQLAYDKSDKSVAFDAFKKQYYENAVAEVIAKNVDLSIPYDATAKLAYEASDKSMAFAAFQKQYYESAVAEVVAKKPVDISIPYDATAQQAFLASDRKTPYAEFKDQYLKQAVAEVTAKQSK